MIKAIACISAVTILSGAVSGCGTVDVSPRRYAHVYLKDPVTPPSTPPSIIPGQNARVYYGYTDELVPNEAASRRLASAWAKTGLFAHVEVTADRTPATEGYSIFTRCSAHTSDDNDSGVLDMMFLMTAGAMPHQRGWDIRNCNTEIFQNGSKVSTSSSEWHFGWLEGGWGGAATLPQKTIVENAFNSAAQHIVGRDVVALKRAFP